MLVNGVWSEHWQPVQKKDAQGRFIRQSSGFRQRIHPKNTNDIAGRYSLYVALICPWATRTLIARSLLGLEDVLPVVICEPFLTDQGWGFGTFPGSSTALTAGVSHVHELYTRSDKEYTGRATVPVLWDTEAQCIVNNESADILRILGEDFRPWHTQTIHLRPPEREDELERFNRWLYENFNNGVYQAGFASSQVAYQEANERVFHALDTLEHRLDGQTYLFGNALTEADIRLFVTLVRFDVAYHGLFKTNRRRISDYPLLSGYLNRLLALPAFANNTNIEHIKQGYYSIKALNPSGIVPQGPDQPWTDRVAG